VIKTEYEIRTIVDSKVSRQTTTSLTELLSLLRDTVTGQRVYVFKIYKSPGGKVLKSEKLDYTMKAGRLGLKTLTEKPAVVRSYPVRPDYSKEKFVVPPSVVGKPKNLFFRPPQISLDLPSMPRASAGSKDVKVLRPPSPPVVEGLRRRLPAPEPTATRHGANQDMPKASSPVRAIKIQKGGAPRRVGSGQLGVRGEGKKITAKYESPRRVKSKQAGIRTRGRKTIAVRGRK
jgi:hypothetical protein